MDNPIPSRQISSIWNRKKRDLATPTTQVTMMQKLAHLNNHVIVLWALPKSTSKGQLLNGSKIRCETVQGTNLYDNIYQ
jgi:hypothetical protein